jgi:DNA-binding transcriptional MerR regulator
MPKKEKNTDSKLYYTIGEVADILGENTSLIRYWTIRFDDIIKPHKNKKGNRLYMSADIDHLKLVHYLVKDKGLTLEGAHKRMKENKTGDDHSSEVVNILDKIKSELLAVKELL